MTLLIGGLLIAGGTFTVVGPRVIRPTAEPGAPAATLPGPDDPLNPAIYIAGGTVARRVPNPTTDTIPVGPRSTLDEGLSGFVEPFLIQQHEVTNEEYGRHDPDHVFEVGHDRRPVVNVTWEDAMAYAVAVGGLLPTEAQWEFAARGPEGRIYPWGDAAPTCDRAYFAGCGDEREAVDVMTHEPGVTPEGVHDLAGNVWEWVMPVWFEPGRTPVNDETRRSRGGSLDDPPVYLRAQNRNNDFPAGFRYISTGFRVVWPAGSQRDSGR